MYDVTKYSSFNLNKTFQLLSFRKTGKEKQNKRKEKKSKDSTNACQIRFKLLVDSPCTRYMGLGMNRADAISIEISPKGSPI